MTDTPATEMVCGVPLEPGERVVFFQRTEPGWQKPVFIVVGLLTFWTIIGAVFFFAGLFSTTQWNVVTTKRFLHLTRKKKEELRVEDIVGIRTRYKGARLRDLTLEAKPGKRAFGIDVYGRDALFPIVKRLAADRSSLEALPTVAAWDRDVLPQPRT